MTIMLVDPIRDGTRMNSRDMTASTISAMAAFFVTGFRAICRTKTCTVSPFGSVSCRFSQSPVSRRLATAAKKER